MDGLSPSQHQQLKLVARYTREPPEDIRERWLLLEPRQIQEEVRVLARRINILRCFFEESWKTQRRGYRYFEYRKRERKQS